MAGSILISLLGWNRTQRSSQDELIKKFGEVGAENWVTVVEKELDKLREAISSGKGHAVVINAAATQSGSPVDQSNRRHAMVLVPNDHTVSQLYSMGHGNWSMNLCKRAAVRGVFSSLPRLASLFRGSSH